MSFSTKDRDNDVKPKGHCAQERKGGWWYDRCFNANLNGVYYNGPKVVNDGIVLYYWKDGYHTVKSCSMKIRRVV